jgi:hypothetical protein
MTRLATLQAQGAQPDLPAPVLAAYLLGHLFDVGPSSAAGMGEVPITWVDLQAWQGATGIELAPWELQGLRTLSAHYLQASRDAQDPDAPAPFGAPPDMDQRDKVSVQIKNIFGNRGRKH